MSISDTESEVIPMCITRRVADTGGIITGGAAQVGRVGVTMRTRSETSWRASRRSVPGLKSSWIDERCATDLERIVVETGHAVQRLLERNGDQGLDVGGGEPQADRLDLDLRWRELRERRPAACRAAG